MREVRFIRQRAINLCTITVLLFSVGVFCASELVTAKTIELSPSSSLPIEGVVGDSDQFVFDLNHNRALLISVARLNSDLKLVLAAANGQTIFTAGQPTRVWLPEQIVVTSAECQKCVLQIEPVDPVDQSGSYQLTTRWLEQTSDADLIAFADHMTHASTLWFNAGHDTKQLRQVFQAYQEALDVARNLSPVHQQQALLLSAYAAHWHDNNDEARKLLNRSLEINASENNQYRTKSLLFLADLLFNQFHEFDSATHYANAAKSAAIEQKDTLVVAAANSLLGLIAAEHDAIDEANQLFEISYQEFARAGDWRRTVQGLINKGWSSYRQSDLEQALNYFQQALTFAQSSNLIFEEIDAAFRIGEVYLSRSDFDQANIYIDQASLLLQPGQELMLTGRVLQAKAKVHFMSGMYELAQIRFEEALNAYSQFGSQEDMINIMSFLARLHSARGDYEAANSYFEKVFRYDLQGGNPYYLAQSYSYLADTAFNQGNYKKALNYIEPAIDYFSNNDNDIEKGALFSLAGMIYFYDDQIEKSDSFFQRAKDILVDNDNSDYQIELDYRIAKSKALQGKSAEAIAALEPAVTTLLHQRSSIIRADLKRSYLALQQKIVALKIQLSLNTKGNDEQTLQLAEMFRSQTLTDRLQSLQLGRVIPTHLARERTSLQNQLQSDAINYHQLSDAAERAKLLTNTRKISAELQRVEALIAEANNTLPQVREPSQEVDIASYQALLDDSSVVLYFDTNPEQSHLWTVTNQVVNAYDLPGDNNISQAVEQTLNLIRESPKNNIVARIRAQRDSLAGLSEILFSKVDLDWTQFSTFIVVADGPLHYLPLSLLTLPGEDNAILESAQVVYVPSLAVFNQLHQHALHRTANKISNELLVIANPLFHSDDGPNKSGGSNVRSGFTLAELPYTMREASAIRGIADNKAVILERENASKKKFLASQPEQYDVIHFATHGLANSETPALSGLLFSNAESDDNLLLAPEIANLQLNAELIVLSACETALGQMIDGEGLQGLSRAFFETGAKRVIASLWAVQDQATAELMSNFYQHLLVEKKPPAEALRLAQLHIKNYRRNGNERPWQDPYYWAGFILQGTGESWLE